MPQSNGLYMEFTILEMINYFAKFLSISKSEVEMKLQNIQNTLSLTNLMSRISTLHYTQRKNLSFAIATLNDPDFLLLDEPTSGSDPYFKYQIWTKIHKLIRNNNTTVLLTTCDSHECENADIIGYLREGKIVLEDSPNHLLTRYNVNSMEKVFFCVTMQMGEPFREPSIIVADDVLSVGSHVSIVSGGFTPTDDDVFLNEPTKQVPEIHSKVFDYSSRVSEKNKFEAVMTPSTTSSNRLLYLFEKELFGFFRNTQKIFAYLILPVICILLLYYTVGGKLTELRLGIVNLEAKSCSQGNNSSQFLSCELIQLIDQNYVKKIFFENRKSARDAAKQGNLDGIIILAQYMTDIMNSIGCLAESFEKSLDYDPKNGTLHLELNYSSKVISNWIIKQIAYAYDKFMMQHIPEIEAGKNFVLQPIKVYNCFDCCCKIVN